MRLIKLFIDERYHGTLRNNFRNIIVEWSQTDKQLAISCTVKAMNDILGLTGSVLSILVFWEYPRLPVRSDVREPRDSVNERACISAIARKEMAGKMESISIMRALKAKVMPARSQNFESGDKISL